MRLLGFILCLAASCAAGARDEWALSQLSRRVWQIEDGLPHNYVTAITTDAQGYLLVGTQAGIARFDGLRFQPYGKLEGAWIYSLFQGSDGTMWVGTYLKGLYAVRDGKTRHWDLPSGNSVFSIREDRAHRIWFVSTEGLHYIADGQIRTAARGTGTDGYAWQSMALDEDGAIWFAASQGVVRYRQGRAESIQVAGASGVPVTIYKLPDSQAVLLGTTTGLFELVCKEVQCRAQPRLGVPGPVVGVRQASDRALWIATWGNGLYRARAGKLERIDAKGGLADDFVRTMAEDSEHNFWVGTRSGGLTRFRETPLKPVGLPEGLGGNYASAVTGDGADGVWLGTWRSGLYHWRDGQITSRGLPENALDVLIVSLATDAGRNVWIGTFRGLLRLSYKERAAMSVALPGGGGNIGALLVARDGALWVAKSGAGVSRFPSGDPRTSDPQVFLAGKTVSTLMEDSHGSMWIGSKDGLWAGNKQVDPQPATVISEDTQGRVWAGGEDGRLAIYAGRQVRQFHSGLPGILSIVDDGHGSIWLGTGRGLARADEKSVEEFAAGRTAAINLVRYGVAEGMRTIEGRGGSPSGWKMADGTVWLPTSKGFVEVVPGFVSAVSPPRAVIEAISVDGRRLDMDKAVRFPPGARGMEVAFTALRLGSAEGVRFRYRIEDVDAGWIEAGKDRVARYNQLPPGKFRLAVAARDPGGQWTDTPASIELEQLPHFYQTLLFRLAFLAALAGAAWAIYALRLQAVGRRHRAVLEERNRIAREWHDTLLAGLSAVSWQLDTASEQCSEPRVIGSLKTARGMLRYCREEARRVIVELREGPGGKALLADSIRAALAKITEGVEIKGRLEVDAGIPRLPEDLGSDLLRICQEAASNAVQHARASEVVVRLACDSGRLRLSIADDGIGMNAETWRTPMPGHFGLLGMRERAQRFGGRLTLESGEGGTIVVADIPLPDPLR